MKLSRQNTIELLGRGGIVKSSDWTTGNGRHTQKRAIPELCATFENPNQIKIQEARELRESKMPINIVEFFKQNPRVKTAIAYIGTEEQKLELLAQYEEIKK